MTIDRIPPQACLNYSLVLEKDSVPTSETFVRLQPTGMPSLRVDGNSTLANTDLRVEDDPANANCQPWRYQFRCTPTGWSHLLHLKNASSSSTAGKCHVRRMIPSNAHISTPFFRTTVVFSWQPPSKFLEVCIN
jgi:hypothetical protein